METLTKELNVLKNRAECMNKVHSYINEIAPKVKTELDKGYKLTVDFQLFKKDKERIQAIIDSVPHFRAFLRVNEFSITLEVDDTYYVQRYHDGTLGIVDYYKKTAYLVDVMNSKDYDLELLPTITEEELIQAKKDEERLEEEIRGLKDELYKAKYILGR